MAPQSAFNSEKERRTFTANLNWYVNKHFGVYKGAASKAAAVAGVKLYTLCDAKAGKLSVDNAPKLAALMGHSFETVCSSHINSGVEVAYESNPLTGQVHAIPAPKRKPKATNGRELRVHGLTFTLRTGKPQLFELGDVKFVIEGRTGQLVKMDINIER